jgi:hypothetical protein
MLVRGDMLSESARREVLSAFGYRWTVENAGRSKSWFAHGKAGLPTIPCVKDSEWLASHAFHVLRDGSRLARNRRFAEPAFMVG